MLSFWTLLSLALSPTPPAPAAIAPQPAVPLVQEEGEVADKRPEIKEAIKAFQTHIKAKGKEDTEAIGIIDQLLQEFPKSGPKDREAIVKALEKSFKAKRTKELEEGVPDDRLYMASAVAFRDMAPESVKPLIGLIDHKSHRKNLTLQATLIVSLGKTKDLSGVKTLLNLLKHKDAELVGASAQAMAEFRGADQKIRKEMFSEMLKILMGLKTQVDNDPNDTINQDRYNLIYGDVINAFQQLTGHDERVPENWQRWWNKNKKADWGTPGQ